MKTVRGNGWHWLTRLNSQRQVNPDRTGNRALREFATAPDGTVVPLTGSGLIQVFRSATPDGDTEYGATDVLPLTLLERELSQARCGRSRCITGGSRSSAGWSAARHGVHGRRETTDLVSSSNGAGAGERGRHDGQSRAPWLKVALTDVRATCPEPTSSLSPAETRLLWARWQEGLTVRIILPSALLALRMLLVWDNLAGHKTLTVVVRLFRHGVMPLAPPSSGSWPGTPLVLTEAIQRILKRRALEGRHPDDPQEIIAWLEATARLERTANAI